MRVFWGTRIGYKDVKWFFSHDKCEWWQQQPGLVLRRTVKSFEVSKGEEEAWWLIIDVCSGCSHGGATSCVFSC